MPQDQDDIKGADAMKQAPTPGPLTAETVGLIRVGDVIAWDGGDPESLSYVHRPDLIPAEVYEKMVFVSRPDVYAGFPMPNEAISDFQWRLVYDPAPVEASGSEREADAWKWLGQLYPNDAPSDLAYDANEMVDAFLAGSGRSDRMAKALERIADEQQYRSGYCQTDITVEPALTAEEAQTVAREALAQQTALRPQPSGETREVDDLINDEWSALVGDGPDAFANPASVCHDEFRTAIRGVLSALRPQPSGFLATLTDEQRTSALARTGDDTHPQPSGETRLWIKHDHLRRISDPQDPMDGCMVWSEQLHADFVQLTSLHPAQEAIDDVISHYSDWREALMASDAAEETPEDGSGKPGYWLHQVKVLDRVLAALIRPAPVASGGQHSSGEGEQ